MMDEPIDPRERDRFAWVVGVENERVPIEEWIERLPQETRDEIETRSGSTSDISSRWFALIVVCTCLLIGSLGTILGSAYAIDRGVGIPIELLTASFVAFAVGRFGLPFGVWRDSVHVTAAAGRRPVSASLAIVGTTVVPPPLEILSAIGYLWYRRRLRTSSRPGG